MIKRFAIKRVGIITNTNSSVRLIIDPQKPPSHFNRKSPRQYGYNKRVTILVN